MSPFPHVTAIHDPVAFARGDAKLDRVEFALSRRFFVPTKAIRREATGREEERETARF
jgi:hypothetical protein